MIINNWSTNLNMINIKFQRIWSVKSPLGRKVHILLLICLLVACLFHRKPSGTLDLADEPLCNNHFLPATRTQIFSWGNLKLSRPPLPPKIIKMLKAGRQVWVLVRQNSKTNLIIWQIKSMYCGTSLYYNIHFSRASKKYLSVFQGFAPIFILIIIVIL